MSLSLSYLSTYKNKALRRINRIRIPLLRSFVEEYVQNNPVTGQDKWLFFRLSILVQGQSKSRRLRNTLGLKSFPPNRLFSKVEMFENYAFVDSKQTIFSKNTFKKISSKVLNSYSWWDRKDSYLKFLKLATFNSFSESGLEKRKVLVGDKAFEFEQVRIKRSDSSVLEVFLPDCLRLTGAARNKTHISVQNYFSNILDCLSKTNICVMPMLSITNGSCSVDTQFRKLIYHSKSVDFPAKTGDKLHYKESSHGDFFSLDIKGYSGWSSISDLSMEEIKDSLNMHDPSVCMEVDAFWQKVESYKGTTKYTQPVKSSSSKRVNILVALQVDHDSVSQLYNMTVDELLLRVVGFAKGYNGVIGIKRHPLCKSQKISSWLSCIQEIKIRNLIVVDVDIREALDSADAVITMNSGVGLEAIMRKKRVFSCGKSDYDSLAINIGRDDEFNSVVQRGLSSTVNEQDYKVFLYYYFNVFCMPFEKRLRKDYGEDVFTK